MVRPYINTWGTNLTTLSINVLLTAQHFRGRLAKCQLKCPCSKIIWHLNAVLPDCPGVAQLQSHDVFYPHEERVAVLFLYLEAPFLDLEPIDRGSIETAVIVRYGSVNFTSEKSCLSTMHVFCGLTVQILKTKNPSDKVTRITRKGLARRCRARRPRLSAPKPFWIPRAVEGASSSVPHGRNFQKV